MKLLLDTNRYSDLAHGEANVVAVVSEAESISLSFVTLAESHAGFRRGSRRVENEHRLAAFLRRERVTLLYADDGTINLWADLKNQLRRQGTMIPDHDIWIAALALQHGLTLYARDKHFDHLPQVARM